jgi:enamine deaminase RidA (YjgF/YER057c/UK114 family)
MTQDLDYRSPDTIHAPFGYSHIVSAPAGRTIWISGQIALEPDGTPAPLEWEAQARLVFANLARALEAAGATFRDIVKVTYFLVDIAGLDVVRRVRNEHFDPGRLPASTLIQVAGLARPDLLLEIEAVVALPGR